MAKNDVNAAIVSLKELLSGDDDFVREAVRGYLQDVLEEEMTAAVGAGKGERSLSRLGYRSGYYERALVTRVGRIELRVPQDRNGRFSTDLFERYQRSEKALVSALTEMYVQGVSTRKVKKITEELCGHRFSASTISSIVKKLDGQLRAFARRRLDEPFPYLIVDARYEKVRENGVIVSQAVLIALGIDWEGRRQVLAVELANRESASSWKEFLLGLKERGLSGVEFTVSDDHAGLKKAIAEVLPEAVWPRCYVHFLRNALDHMPRKRDDDCLQELRWLYDRRDLSEARRDLAAWLQRWQGKYPKLTDWVAFRPLRERGQYRGDPRLLPVAPSAPQAPQIDQHAGTLQPGDQTADPCRARLSQCGKLPQADPRARRRNPRGLARGQPLHQHETTRGAQTRTHEGSRLRAARHGRRCDTPCLRAIHARENTRQHGQTKLQKIVDITWRPLKPMLQRKYFFCRNSPFWQAIERVRL